MYFDDIQKDFKIISYFSSDGCGNIFVCNKGST